MMTAANTRAACTALALGLASPALAQSGNQWAPQPAQVPQAAPVQPPAQGGTIWNGGQGAQGPVFAPDDLDARLDGEAGVAGAQPAAPLQPALQAPQQQPVVQQPAPQQPVLQVPQAAVQQQVQQPTYAPLQQPAQVAPAPQAVQPAVPVATLPSTGLYGLPYGTTGYGYGLPGYGTGYGALPYAGYGAVPYAGAGYGLPYAGYGALPYAGTGYGLPYGAPGLGLPYYGWNLPGSTVLPLGSTDFTPGLLSTNPYSPFNSPYGGTPYFGGAPFGFW